MEKSNNKRHIPDLRTKALGDRNPGCEGCLGDRNERLHTDKDEHPHISFANDLLDHSMSAARAKASGHKLPESNMALISPPKQQRDGGSKPPVPVYECDWIRADHNASWNCLWPPSGRYPRDMYLKYINLDECEFTKFWVSYVRSYRMTYWALATFLALKKVPLNVRLVAWDLDYMLALPQNPEIIQGSLQYIGRFLGRNNQYAPFRIRDFFGAYSESNLNYIISVLKIHLSRFVDGYSSIFGYTRFTFVLKNCDPLEGHNNGISKITLCSTAFYGESTSYLAWIIGHELLHGVLGMEDQEVNGVKAYGATNARDLAEDAPWRAIINIDNYGIWMLGMFYRWNHFCNLFAPLYVGGGVTYYFHMPSQSWQVQTL